MTDRLVGATGRCLCGAIRFEIRGPARWIGHCWCESCRRATSAAVATFVGVDRAAVVWSGAAPKSFASSPGVDRRFCGACGSQLAYLSDRWPDEIHLYAASLDDPERAQPTFHVHCADAVGWFRAEDGLPHHPRSHPE